MKIQIHHSESGIASVIVFALLAIMVLLVTAETSALIRLHREVKLVEQRQLQRLNGPQTNLNPATAAEVK
jgi:hypothetical protein